MKTKIVALMMLAGAVAFAQPDRERLRANKEKIEAKKIAYITDQLSLTSKQAQEFWPVYNEYSDKLDKAREEQLKVFRSDLEEPKKIEDMSDAELDEMMQMRFKMERRELDLKMEYHERFKKVLEVRQVAKLYKAEHEFKRVLFEEMRSSKPEHRKGPSDPNKGRQRFKE